MTNERRFDIRVCEGHARQELACPLCGDRFLPLWIAIHTDNNEPICDLCGWERASNLANLMALADAVSSYAQMGMPDDVFQALQKRRSDPKRLKKELQEAHKSLTERVGQNQQSSLAKLVGDQIATAIKSKNAEKMGAAKVIYDESLTGLTPSLDDEIPF